MIGKTLSHYKVLEKIGQGGMGEVYRAEDTNLSREVAIKVLPEQFTKDPQRLARFEREAKLLASLNHPNIAAIYGFEEADDVRFLAMELVPGETLQERVAKGPLPVEEALEVCRQIAEGVEAAHEKGVIHRDLKPANVKVTPEGKVKILDFGLAKAFEDEIPAADISQSPTLTEEMTRAGVILGTAAYMSPEQAKGKPVDKRTDIFAFGSVLYELLTGKRAFEGETVTETIAKVLESEPRWDVLPDNTPWTIRNLLRRCLTKDPHDRLDGIANVRVEIKLAVSEPATVSPIGVGSTVQPTRRLWAMAVGLVVLTAVVIGLAIWGLLPPRVLPPLTKFAITPSLTTPLADAQENDLAISADGRQVLYRASGERGVQLYLHSMDDLVDRPIPGTEGTPRGNPFFSPDGKSVAFFRSGRLHRVSLSGGSSIGISDASGSSAGSWGSDDTIVFSASLESGQGLYRVSASGGEPEILATPDFDKGETGYHAPQILPGGKAVLFFIALLPSNSNQVAALSLDTGEKKIIIEDGRQATYVNTGHLIYAQTATGNLMAVSFDLTTLEVTSGPVTVLQGVRQRRPGFADYALSEEGTLVYVQVGSEGQRGELVWVDRKGTERIITEEKRNFLMPRISPDETRVSVAIVEDDGSRNVWIYDFEHDLLKRLTFEGEQNLVPIWTPDGKWITFDSNRDGPRHLFRRLSDGSGPAEPLHTTTPTSAIPTSWSPDGSELAFHSVVPGGNRDIFILPMEGDQEPRILITSPNNDCCAVFSPDGKWLAYVSTERDQLQVYVSPYPEVDVKYLVSGDQGGGEPVWSRDGTELFYRSGNKMMVASIETEPTFRGGKPEELFEGSYTVSGINPGFLQYYDISPDGQQFLMIKTVEGSTAQIHVVLNWFEELKRLVPTP